MSDYDDAVSLFRAFHNREPRKGDIVEIKQDGDITALYIGEQAGILYTVPWEKKPFFHRFSKNNRPLLLVSSDGSQMITHGGAYRFTPQGFKR